MPHIQCSYFLTKDSKITPELLPCQNIWKALVLFVGRLTPLLWTSGDVYPGFQSQGGSPHLRASSPVCNRFLRFTSGATPADHLVTSMAPQPFDPHTCTRVRHWWDLNPGSWVRLVEWNYYFLSLQVRSLFNNLLSSQIYPSVSRKISSEKCERVLQHQ